MNRYDLINKDKFNVNIRIIFCGEYYFKTTLKKVQ